MSNTPFFGLWCLAVFLMATALTVSAQEKVTVQFAHGATGTDMSGYVEDDQYVDYLLRASAGQTLWVNVVRRDGKQALLNVLKGGQAIADDAVEVTTWSGKLPSSETYTVRVFLAKPDRQAGKAAHYHISFTIGAGK